MREWLIEFLDRHHLKLCLAVIAIAVLIFGGVIFSVAKAADATVSWTAPTQNTDGSAIPASGDGSLNRYIVYHGDCNTNKTGFTGTPTQVPVPATQTSVVISGFALGTTKCFGVVAENSYGVQSSMSTIGSKTWAAPKPNPPTIVTISGLVWEVKLDADGLRLARAVGTVPAGKPCQGLAPLLYDDLFVVRRADVQLERGVKPGATLVAQCDAT